MTYNPLTSPIDWILLAPQTGGEKRRSPGLATIVGAGSPRQWDEQGGPGMSGSILLFRGRKLSKFSVEIRLITAEDWAAWEEWRSLVQKPPYGSRPKAQDIWHPWLEALEIKSVVIEDVSQPVPDDNGGHVVTIKMIEWRKLRLSLAKPEESAAPGPADPNEERILQLRAQRDALAGDL